MRTGLCGNAARPVRTRNNELRRPPFLSGRYASLRNRRIEQRTRRILWIKSNKLILFPCVPAGVALILGDGPSPDSRSLFHDLVSREGHISRGSVTNSPEPIVTLGVCGFATHALYLTRAQTLETCLR